MCTTLITCPVPTYGIQSLTGVVLPFYVPKTTKLRYARWQVFWLVHKQATFPCTGHSGIEAMFVLEDLQQRVCSGFTPDSLFTGITGTKSTAKVNQKVKNAKGKSKK